MLRGTLMQGRWGHLLAMVCRAGAFPEQRTSALLSHPAQPLDQGVQTISKLLIQQLGRIWRDRADSLILPKPQTVPLPLSTHPALPEHSTNPS